MPVTDWSVSTKLEPCWCYNCLNDPRKGPNNPVLLTFIVCPECGNKRCPRATDHHLACTKSNAPGQPGSRFGGEVIHVPE